MPPRSPVRSSTGWPLPDEAATERLGEALADALAGEREAIRRGGLHIGLSGDLGAGKTTLVRALLRRSGIQGSVKSPTFALLEPYAVSRLNFYHFDFYRFRKPAEFAEAGFRDLFGAGCVCLTEWPERAGEYLPPLDLEVRLDIEDAGRHAELSAFTETAERCLEGLTMAWRQAPAAD